MREYFLIIFWLVNTTLQADSLHIIAVGDVLLHTPLQKKGFEKGFTSLWLPVLPDLKKGDILYGNLEGPTADMTDNRGNLTESMSRAYTSYPMFNYPPALVTALKESGFVVVSTANNHVLDRLSVGIDKTIDTLHDNKIAYTGTRRKDSIDQ